VEVIGAAYAAEDHGAHEGGLPNPMHQFEIKRLVPFELFGLDVSFTNSALFMVIAAALITLFTVYAMRGGALVPTRLQSVAEISYEFIANMVRDNVIGVTLIGFWKHGVKFLNFFVPSGVPVVMLPLLVIIELISYLTRPISLSVRLFANMMAGHTMLKVFGAFVVALGFLGGWAALAFMVAFTGLEILVAFLQAYVFAILTCIYLNDALHMHH